ncbi:type I-E CRISPR-associated protein Cas6/Cse3/CasE [Endozoicomonas sp. Mp262]|uniref:type I-E CRISPR-associated protein Cas6/Cse3/CasE n=1 Tax=Endozoicomonas sp. Mp262 TaxID=2919499 RepID=UPI0021E0F727
MYLSRIQLTPAIAKHSQLGHILRDSCYAMHRLLWDLFDQNERFLFREEQVRDQLEEYRNLPLYYVLSRTKPKADNPFFNIESKCFQPKLKEDDQLSFCLRANPTITRRVEGKKNSTRHDVIMDAQYQWLKKNCIERGIPMSGSKSNLRCLLASHDDFSGEEGFQRMSDAIQIEMTNASVQWLSKRGVANGFTVMEGSVQSSGYQWHALPKKGRNAGFSALDYEGVLAITEPEKFISALFRGIGPAKAFGCGLLLIKRT